MARWLATASVLAGFFSICHAQVSVDDAQKQLSERYASSQPDNEADEIVLLKSVVADQHKQIDELKAEIVKLTADNAKLKQLLPAPSILPTIPSLVFPGTATQGRPDATLATSDRYELINLHAPSGTKIAAVFGTAIGPPGKEKLDPSLCPTVLYFYGNATCAAYCMGLFTHLRKMGINVIMPDYEGYGMSDGTPSEGGCYAAADAAYDYLMSRKDIDPKRLIAMGWSLGSAVAIDMAHGHTVQGLIALSSFTSMPDMVRKIAPVMPEGIELSPRFDSLGKISDLACPILLVHGTDDTLVPPEMADRLAAAARTHVIRITVLGAGHNDIFETGGARLWNAIEAFAIAPK